VMVGSFRTTVARWVEQTLRADLFVTPASGRSGPSFGRLPDEAIALVESVEGVADVDPYLAFGATRDGVPFTVGSGRFEVLAARGRLPLLDGRDVGRVALEAKQRGTAFVSEPYAEKFRVSRGDLVEIPSDRGPVPLRVAAVYVDYSNDRGTITIDRNLFRKVYGLSGAVSLAVTLDPGLDPEEGRRRLLAASAGRFALRVRTNATLKRSPSSESSVRSRPSSSSGDARSVSSGSSERRPLPSAAPSASRRSPSAPSEARSASGRGGRCRSSSSTSSTGSPSAGRSPSSGPSPFSPRRSPSFLRRPFLPPPVRPDSRQPPTRRRP